MEAPVRAVLFDLDDTLVDHSHATLMATRAAVALERALADASFDAVVAQSQILLERFHPQAVAGHLTFEQARVERYRELLRTFGCGCERAEELAAVHLRAYREAERAVPGVKALLDHLRARGITLAIVSNNTRAEQEAKLRRRDLFDHFAEIIVSGDHKVSKPDPRLFTIALDKLGVAAKSCVHVGDSWDIDVCGAVAAGIRPVWLNRFKRAPGIGPVVVEIATFDDLHTVVAALLEPTGRR